MVIIEKFDELLKQKNEENSKNRSDIKTRYSASDISKNCKRYLFFSMMNVEKEDIFDDKSKRTLEIGNYIHQMVQDILSKYGKNFHIKSEHRFETKLSENDQNIVFSGFIDDLIWVEHKGIIVAEYKTINQKGFEYLGNKPKPEHYAQIQLYMHFMNLQRGIILYVNKNASEVREYKLSYDKDEVDRWLEFIRDTNNNYIDKLKLPDIPNGYEENKFPCAYCHFKNYCYGGKEWKNETFNLKMKEYMEKKQEMNSNTQTETKVPQNQSEEPPQPTPQPTPQPANDLNFKLNTDDVDLDNMDEYEKASYYSKL